MIATLFPIIQELRWSQNIVQLFVISILPIVLATLEIEPTEGGDWGAIALLSWSLKRIGPFILQGASIFTDWVMKEFLHHRPLSFLVKWNGIGCLLSLLVVWSWFLCVEDSVGVGLFAWDHGLVGRRIGGIKIILGCYFVGFIIWCHISIWNGGPMRQLVKLRRFHKELRCHAQILLLGGIKNGL